MFSLSNKELSLIMTGAVGINRVTLSDYFFLIITSQANDVQTVIWTA